MITVIYFWQIKKVLLPVAILFMAIHKFVLKRLPGVSFVKLLGTGKGESFTPKDADPYRWGALVTIQKDNLDNLDKSKVIIGWQKIAKKEYRAILKPISVHGLWSGKQPFEVEKFDWNGKIAAITRARIGKLYRQ